nr:hypothetical protein [Tanacetum cinerariifolium]
YKVIAGSRIESGFLSQKVDSGNAAKEVVSPPVVEETVAKERKFYGGYNFGIISTITYAGNYYDW